MWRRFGTAAAAGALFAAILGGSAIAMTNVATQETEPTSGVDVAFADDWQIGPEEIAMMNADTDALVEHLESLGFDVTVETDDDGFRYPVLGEDDEAMMTAIDAFYQARFVEEVATWSDAEKAEWNAGTDAIIADLAEQGVTAGKVEIAPGVYDIDWSEELDAALMDSDGSFIGDGVIDWEIGPEEIAMMNADTDALVEHLESLGFDVTVETDDDGFRYPVLGEDDEAMMTAIDAFYQARFVEEVATWSDAEKAEWNAGTDAIIADLAEQGVTAGKVEIAPGVYDIDWTEEIDAALMELEGDDFVIIDPGGGFEEDAA